jgi:hypothetical protein
MSPEPDEAAVDLEVVREFVARMFECVGIRRVICVDDVYAGGLPILQEVLAVATPQERAAVLQEEVGPRMENADIVHELAARAWDAADQDGREELLRRARQQAGGTDQGRFLAMLESLLPDVEKKGLGLREWRACEDNMLEELSTMPTLFLFDQSFSDEEPGTEKIGQRIIAGVQQKVAPGGDVIAYYGLLTNLVLPDDEHHARQGIVADEHLDSSRFILISKHRLVHPLPQFAARLRTLLLAPLFAGLFIEVKKCIERVREDAIGQASGIEPEDLEHMVFESSTREGVWEPETLIRILEILQRSKARAAVRNDSAVSDYVRRLRCLGTITVEAQLTAADEGIVEVVSAQPSAPPGPPSPRSSAPGWKIRRQEIYEDRAHINGLHLPVELGDIFQQTESNTEYILVAQPCDTMVRSSGAREPELTHFILAAIERGSDGGGRLDRFRLPYYDESTGVDGNVRLNRVKFVRARVLDFCVFNERGNSVFVLGEEAPSGLVPAWHSRHASYGKVIKKVLADVGTLGGSASKATKATFVGDVTGSPFQAAAISPQDGRLAFNCERVARLCDPFARALLTRFGQYFSRDAEPHDFAIEDGG